MRSLFCLLALWMHISLSFAQTGQEGGPGVDELEAKADVASQQKDYEKAAALYEQALEREPENDRLLCSAGIAYFYLKEYHKAKEKFRLAILYAPEENATYCSNLSAAYNNLGDNERAYDYALRALNIKENDHTLFNAASNANNLGRYRECIKILDKATIPLSAEVHSLYGRAYISLRQPDKAIEHYTIFFRGHNPAEYVTINLDDERSTLYGAYLYDMALKAFAEQAQSPDWECIGELYRTLMNTGSKRAKTWQETIERAKEILPRQPSLKAGFAGLLSSFPGLTEEERITAAYTTGDIAGAKKLAENWLKEADTYIKAQRMQPRDSVQMAYATIEEANREGERIDERIRKNQQVLEMRDIVFFATLEDYLEYWKKGKKQEERITGRLEQSFAELMDEDLLTRLQYDLGDTRYMEMTVGNIFTRIMRNTEEILILPEDRKQLIRSLLTALPESELKAVLLREGAGR